MGQLRKGASFAAIDGDGRRYHVVNWVEYVDQADGEPVRPRWVPSGLECLRLDDGRAVSALDGGRYEIAGLGVPLQRVADPSPARPGPVRPVDPEPSRQDVPPRATRAIDDDPECSEHTPSAATDAGLMATFGIRRSGRFYLCRGYRYTHLRDAVAYARQARDRPDLVLQEPPRERSAGAGATAGSNAPHAQDVTLMAFLRITFAQGQYVFDGYRYDRLQDAVAYARLQQSRPAP